MHQGKHPDRTILLDVTRTLSRADGRVRTGVDRVEAAYIAHLCNRDAPVQFLARLGSQRAVLGRDTLTAIMRQMGGAARRERLDAKAMLSVARDPNKRWVETMLRRYALRRDGHLMPPDSPCHYINVGHTHLDALPWLHKGGADSTVMIHDMIPLDRPETQTPNAVHRFAAYVNHIGQSGSRIIANSDATAARVRHWFTKLGFAPEIVTAHLGVDPPLDVAPHISDRPYVVQLGTIEPRKNVGFALDIWDHLNGGGPDLCLIGRRGWMIDDIAARLDRARPKGVQELNTLTDVEVQARIKGAAAVIFPSQEEGFGLPLLEALQHGTPVIASDLPVFKELAGDHALYLPTDDVNTWANCILGTAEKFAKDEGNRAKPDMLHIPRWKDHFAIVDRLL